MELAAKTLQRPELRRRLFIAALFLLCVLAAFLVRTWHFNHEAESVVKVIGDYREEDRGRSSLSRFLPFMRHNFMPFTIESAMMFSYTQDIAAGKGVPASDKGLVGLEDIPPYGQMVMGLEWFLGYGYRLKSLVFKDPPPSAEDLRCQSYPGLALWASFQIRLWVSLASGFIFLWLIVLRCPWPLALLGGLLHAVALSAIARSTGQDLVRGEFCIPLILATMLLAHSIYRRGALWKTVLLFVASFLAFATWDLCQMLFCSWAVFEILRVALGGAVTSRRRTVWIVLYVAVVLNALFVPFHKVYLQIESPFLLVVLPTLMLMLFMGCRLGSPAKRALLAIGALLLLYGAWTLFIKNQEYLSVYSHFGELMKAKIHFRNVEPRDPRLMSFDARMMWTPSMNSATWPIAATFFPSLGALCPLTLPGALEYLWLYIPFTLGCFLLLLLLGLLAPKTRSSIVRGLPRSLMPYLFTAGFLLGFVFIVRYHEFVIIFLCLSLPLLIHDLSRAFRTGRRMGVAELLGFSGGPRLAVPRLLLLGVCASTLLLESSICFFKGERAYTGDVYLSQTAKLIEWFRRSGSEGKVVVADFTIGPMLKAYCGMGICMQPQFGIQRIRRPVEVYLNIMYHGDERALSEFCLKHRADFIVYDKGFANPSLHPFSNRYIAAAIPADERGDSPSNMMANWPDRMKWFYRIDPPSDLKALSVKFSVFKVIKPQDRVDSIKMVFEGESALSTGDLPLAGRLAKAAIWLDPVSEQAKLLYFKVFKRVPVLTLNAVL